VITIGLSIDWGSAGTTSKKPLAANDEGWLSKVSKLESGKSSKKGTPFVKIVWKVLDEDAVNVDGEAFKGSIWDTYYLVPTALWRLKKTLSAFGIEVGDEVEDFDSEAEFADYLSQQLLNEEARVATSLRDDPDGKTYDGTDDVKQYVDVDEVLAA
jgi:hypothetical protein